MLKVSQISRWIALGGLWLLLVTCQPAVEPVGMSPPVQPVINIAPTATAVPIETTVAPTLTPVVETVTPSVTPTPLPTLCVPSPPPGWVLTTIQPGNNLFRLGQRGGTTVEELMRVNCRENDILYVGEQLYTPPGSGYDTNPNPPTDSLGVTIVPPPIINPPTPTPPPVIPPAPPPCETPPCDELPPLPTLPPVEDPTLLPTLPPPDDSSLLPTLPPNGGEQGYPAVP